MRPQFQLLRASRVHFAPSTSHLSPRNLPLLQQHANPLRPTQHPLCQLRQHQYQQQRFASILGSLSDNKGAYSKKIRRGRGPSSGKGKTSGRGHKGQKQHGKVPAGFQGGQTPVEVVHGKHGFVNNFAADLSPVNLDRIQDWIDQGRLNTDKIITIRELCSSRCIHGAKNGVKLLARNADLLTSRIDIIVSRASATAIAAIERLGGTVTTRYYTPVALRRIRMGLMDPIVSTDTLKTSPLVSQWRSQQLTIRQRTAADRTQQLGELPAYRYRLPDPARRKDLEYYRDPAHRGYLAHTLKKKEGPSLFMRDKPRAKHVGQGQKEKQKAESENKIW